MSTAATEPTLGDTVSSSASDKSKSASPPGEHGAPTRNKRRSHKKSRAGCENCKVRRVKCDECKPKCNKCINYGIECNYDSRSGGMLFAGESSFAIQPPVKAPEHGAMVLKPLTKTSDPMPPLRTLEDQFTPSKWMSADLDILSKFQERTVLTVGSRTNAGLYKNEVFKLAINYPFLTHVVLTLTLLHDRHLTGLTTIGERAALHWYQGTAMFQNALLKPEKQSQRDALWASASMLGCIQFAAIEARTPEEAWPLAPPSNNDLDWLKMSDGKKAVWRICQANKAASVFSTLRGHTDIYRPIVFDGHEIANVTREFCDVFGLGPLSNVEENPYHGAAMQLARLLPIACDEKTILEFLVCMTQISPKLKVLLAEKEPKALLLVACWYAKIYKYQWWIHRRGLLEGQAICIYLDRFYSHASSLQNLLKFPKMAFGLAFATSEADQLQTVLAIRPRIAAVAG